MYTYVHSTFHIICWRSILTHCILSWLIAINANYLTSFRNIPARDMCNNVKFVNFQFDLLILYVAATLSLFPVQFCFQFNSGYCVISRTYITKISSFFYRAIIVSFETNLKIKNNTLMVVIINEQSNNSSFIVKAFVNLSTHFNLMSALITHFQYQF